VDGNGKAQDVKGYVDSVKLTAGQAYVVIGDKEYPASAISDVQGTPAFQPDDISKAATYIGKYVTVRTTAEEEGYHTQSGYVQSVEYKAPYAYIVFEDGSSHPMGSITDVRASDPKAIPNAPEHNAEGTP
jgi:hypothetical protein